MESLELAKDLNAGVAVDVSVVGIVVAIAVVPGSCARCSLNISSIATYKAFVAKLCVKEKTVKILLGSNDYVTCASLKSASESLFVS